MAGGTKVTTTDPWKEQQEYLKTGFKRAEDLYGRGMPKYYTGETLAGFDPEQRRAQASILNYARGPRVGAMQGGAERALLSKLSGQTPFTDDQTGELLSGSVPWERMPGAQGNLQQMMSGSVPMGEGTPYGDLADAYRQQFEDQASQGLANVRQGLVNYQPGGGSRGDIYAANVVGAQQKALAQNLAQMYGGAYQTAQGQRLPAIQQQIGATEAAQARRMPMAQMAIGQQTAGMGAYPTIMGAPMGMYGAMADVGAQRRSMAQEAINRDMQKYQYEAGAPQSALQNYLASVTGDYGSVVTAPGKDYTGNILGMIAGALG